MRPLKKTNYLQMKKRIYILGLLLLFFMIPAINIAQSNALKLANDLYDNLAFSDAISKYEEVLVTDSLNAEALIKLANCYRLTNNNKKALQTYAIVVKLAEAQPIHTLFYAQELMAAGKYEEAKICMKNYSEDERGNIFSLSIENMKKFYRHVDNYDITKVNFNSSKNDFSPAFWNDNIVFTSSRERASLISYKSAWTGHNFDALYFVKLTKDGTFSKPELFNKDLQSRYNLGTASFSNEGKFMYFTQNNIINNEEVRDTNGRLNLKILQATLNNNGKFGDVKDFFYNNDAYNCAHPAINSDGTILFFSSDMPGGFGGMDIWVSFKKDSLWTQPENLGAEYNSAGNELFPYIFRDSILYYSSNGLEGMGGLDIYKTLLDNTGMPYGKLTNLGAPINTPMDDFGIAIMHDGKSGYYSSNFGNTNNDDDILAFKIIKPFINIKGIVADKHTNSAVPFSKITLKNESGEYLDDVISNENGEFTLTAIHDRNYKIEGFHEDYFCGSPVKVSTQINALEKEVIAKLTLEKKVNVNLNIYLTDLSDDKPLNNVTIQILNKKNNESSTYSTSALGDCLINLTNLKLNDSLVLKITLSKDKYVTKEIEKVYFIDKTDVIYLKESIGMIKVGVKINDLLSINPIYFDFDKHNIRKDAAIELDKVVALMKQYPDIKIELGSHTDCRGKKDVNMKLSVKRARASANYIVSKGISRKRINYKGYGETQLINDCDCKTKRPTPCSKEEHALNRRTEFIIIGEIDL